MVQKKFFFGCSNNNKNSFVRYPAMARSPTKRTSSCLSVYGKTVTKGQEGMQSLQRMPSKVDEIKKNVKNVKAGGKK